jgi:hypothetical protein
MPASTFPEAAGTMIVPTCGPIQRQILLLLIPQWPIEVIEPVEDPALAALAFRQADGEWSEVASAHPYS